MDSQLREMIASLSNKNHLQPSFQDLNDLKQEMMK